MATESTGAGLSAGGTSPFGIGTPATATAPPESPPDAAAFIDFRFSRDYELGADGEVKRMPVQRQRVALALAETRGSSTVRPNDGHDRPKKIDERFARLEEQSVRRSLAQMTDVEKSLSVDAVVAEHPSDGVIGRTATTVTYTDRTNGEHDALNI